MLQIDDKIVSRDLLTECFHCHLEKCHGNCCVYGDAGAPLEEAEISMLNEIFDLVRPYMRKEGVDACLEQGTYVVDADGDKVTPLINKKECAYVVFENDVAWCAIEKAFYDGVIDFKKPVSCHLYPVRIKKYEKFEAIHYDRWEICKPAVTLGDRERLPVFRFLKEPLVRKYGDAFYQNLEDAWEYLNK